MNDFTRKNDPAHPLVFKPEMIKDRQHVHLGISKREYFAALAMQGLLAQMPERTSSAQIAKEAVMCADKLIEALNK